jgi:8-oxo-dGTP pyrophosphatase MutT (NUDIX family)
MSLPLREAVRAVVTDERGRLLLVRFALPAGPLWAAPGGGVEPGESHEAALRRELREEVGLEDFELGPVIWTRTHIFPLSPEFGGQRETFSFIRVRAFTASPSFSDQQLLAEGVTGSRWWTLEELSAPGGDRFAPKILPKLYRSLMTNGPPDEPIDAGE